ncbi:MAG: DNA mismatch endonuclease Vsr [Chloroflexi bacterium]|nr:DNA mismatch endonuclease Vsr [Chloroflexota bacterium]
MIQGCVSPKRAKICLLKFIFFGRYNQRVDTRSKEKRSRIMAAVHSKNTTTELLVRRFLWSHGIRYRIHPSYLPGKPDIIISRCKLVIFVHGCFWHGHENCSRGRPPKSRVRYWKSKVKANKKRDCLIEEKLKAEGWRQLVIWECQLRTQKSASIALPKVLDSILDMCPEIALKGANRP